MHFTQQMVKWIFHKTPYHSHRRSASDCGTSETAMSAPRLSCPMITVWRWPSLGPRPRLRHIHTLSYHHFNTMEISNVHKFRTNVVPITDARDYGCCHQSNLLAWSSSGCMTLRRSRRQGKSRISENEAAAATTKPPISNKTLCRSSLVLYSCTQEMSSSSTKPFLVLDET